MVLLSPAPALMRLSWQTFLHMLPVLAVPTRAMYYWSFQWMTTMPMDNKHPYPLVEQFMIGTKTFRPQELSMGMMSVFTDDELRGINVPTLLLIGEHEVIYPPDKALERALNLIPNVEAELIAGGGHLFPVDQADATNARILDFLGRPNPAPHSAA
jgi:pimeloyl-ACP methyl ester carboxylesterase